LRFKRPHRGFAPAGTPMSALVLNSSGTEEIMGAILLWLLGVPIPIIILIALFSH